MIKRQAVRNPSTAIVATTPAEEAARPLAEGGCPFVRS